MHNQKSIEGNSLRHIDASIHLSRFTAEVRRCSFEATKKEAETRLEVASRNARITIVRNVAFPNTIGSWRRAIGNLVKIRMVRTSELESVDTDRTYGTLSVPPILTRSQTIVNLDKLISHLSWLDSVTT